MKRLSTALTCLGLIGCVGTADLAVPEPGQYSPKTSAELDVRMFNRNALSTYGPDDRAYVAGHAVGVYLFGKSLPKVIGRSGFGYSPGISSSHARVPYRFQELVALPTGGVDGCGGEASAGTLPVAGTTAETGTDTGSGGGAGSATGGGGGAGGGGGGAGTPIGLNIATSRMALTECPTDAAAGDGGASACPPEPTTLDESCEDFLNPAAQGARVGATDLNVPALLGEADGGTVTDTQVQKFQAGVRDALAIKDFHEDVESSEVEHLKKTVQGCGMCAHSPLVLDLAGDGVEASAPEAGVQFDLLSTGHAVQSAWPKADNALLVLDRDGDGRISSGAELFGNASGFGNGFLQLAELDQPARGGNGDGIIDARDVAFSRLRLWRDRNRDGVSQPDELQALASARVVALSYAYASGAGRDRFGNPIRQTGAYWLKGEKAFLRRVMADVWFRYLPVPSDLYATVDR